MVVEDFSCRTITFEEYTFPGISGLAKEVQRHTGYGYGAVIRTHDFHNGPALVDNRLWFTIFNVLAPSWSWVALTRRGILHPVALSPVLDHEKDVFVRIAQILRIELVYAGKDESGRITSGKLHLKAPCRSVGPS